MPERVVPNGSGTGGAGGTATTGDAIRPAEPTGRAANRRTGVRTLGDEELAGRPAGDDEPTNGEAVGNAKTGWQLLRRGTSGDTGPVSQGAATGGGATYVTGIELDAGATRRDGSATAGSNVTAGPNGPRQGVIRVPARLSTLMAQRVRRKERPSDRRTKYDWGSLHTS
jgi:hypothetical protein